MKQGRTICESLKAVRRRIADENGIPLEIPECTYAGPCRGTCPRCEAELHYLENELAKRISVGKVATVAGLAMTLASCGSGTSDKPTNTANEVVESEILFDTSRVDSITTPPQPSIPDTLPVLGMVGDEGFVVDTQNVPRDTLEYLQSCADPLPDDCYNEQNTASCNPLDEPTVVIRGESGSVVTVNRIVRRRSKVLVPKTQQEQRSEAEQTDAFRALPPMVNVDEVDGVKIIHNDEQR